MQSHPILLAAVFALTSAAAQTAPPRLNWELVNKDFVRSRLQQFHGSDETREQTLEHMFLDAGCPAASLQEVPVKHTKTPDLLCIITGELPDRILIGAHYDHVSDGSGVVDNWSGASLLPSLLQSFAGQKPHHTLVFAAFSSEEKGLVGSRAYVNGLSPDELNQIRAVLIIDTLALGPTEVWATRSDQTLARVLAATAKHLNLPLTSMNVDNVGESDEEPFIEKKIPSVMVHSLTSATFRILHSPKDNWSAVRFDDYYDSYRLLTAYLHILDNGLEQYFAVKQGNSVR